MVLLDIDDNKATNKVSFISSAIKDAELVVQSLNEDIESIKNLRPNCDKLDYILAAGSGALCGIIDIFLVGKPGETPIGDVTDKWFSERTIDFAKIMGYKPKADSKLENAVTFLENKFKVPYDQTSLGDAAKQVFGLNTNATKHHFESLAHNPSLLGLFFSILDQFRNTSHFIIEGQLICLIEADDKFQLRGTNILSKLFCGIYNWICHLISDVSGSHTSIHKGNRGMGIPSPLWTWANDIFVIRRKLGISETEFDRNLSNFGLEIFNNGFDFRFQTTQAIPVLVNELVVRSIYSIRRIIKYYASTLKEERNYKTMWQECKPFGNSTISRMLTVAHASFCLVDIGDATIRGFATGAGNFNALEFCLRLNVAGIGRFTISLYGEGKREFNYYNSNKHIQSINKNKKILDDYIEGLKEINDIYDDSIYMSFIEDISNHDYISAFNKTTKLATLRGAIPVMNKADIDEYFSTKKQL